MVRFGTLNVTKEKYQKMQSGDYIPQCLIQRI